MSMIKYWWAWSRPSQSSGWSNMPLSNMSKILFPAINIYQSFCLRLISGASLTFSPSSFMFSFFFIPPLPQYSHSHMSLHLSPHCPTLLSWESLAPSRVCLSSLCAVSDLTSTFISWTQLSSWHSSTQKPPTVPPLFYSQTPTVIQNSCLMAKPYFHHLHMIYSLL